MAFVVQCPFCKLRAKVPDRAMGGIGHCPKCANAFTLASLDDQHLPEPAPAATALGPPTESEAVAASSAVDVAIAVAAAEVAANDTLPIASPGEVVVPPAPSKFHPASAAGASALLLGGLALVAGAVPLLHGFVLPLSAAGVLTGLAALIIAVVSARRRLLLPIVGSAAATAMLVIAWFFPTLLGPAYEHARKRPEPTPSGLHAIPLAGAPALAEVPEWADSKRYALGRDGLRVQVVRVSLLPPAADRKGLPTGPKGCFLVCVRVSSEGAQTKPLEWKDNPAPTLTDDAGKVYAFQQSELFDRGGGKDNPAAPTIEETFVFDAPAAGWKTVHLELPAARWGGNDVFRFMIRSPASIGPVPQGKK